MKSFRHVIRTAALGTLACGALLAGPASAAAQEASTTYKGTARDPFVKYRPPVRRLPKKASPVAPPSAEERIAMYKSMKAAAMSAQRPAPKPTTALLVGEVQVTGIFRTPRGYAAMVEATPIKLSYVIYPGEQFFDGQLVAIEESRLVFRRVTRWTDGRRVVAVDTKPLRQQTVADALTAVRQPEAGAAAPKEDAKPAGQSPSAAPGRQGEYMGWIEQEAKRRGQSVEEFMESMRPKGDGSGGQAKGYWQQVKSPAGKDIQKRASQCQSGKGYVNQDGSVTCKD